MIFWVFFIIFIITFLALDLGVFHRKNKIITFPHALFWVCFWFLLAVIFAIGLYITNGPTKSLTFLTAYLLEQALSLDNIFIFVLLFQQFAIPDHYQYRVLFWGVIGALIMRFILIMAGIELISHFQWMMYVFGVFLIFTAIKMLFSSPNLHHNKILRFLQKKLPITPHLHGEKFIVRVEKKLFFTPLFIVLIFVEMTDLIFALDSVPAIISITQDPFIIYTSNCFAIMGLRSLYFVLKNLLTRLHYLSIGLALLLLFIGSKMLLHGIWHPPIYVTLLTIGGILIFSFIASYIWPKKQKDALVVKDQL